jgi:hypothetical protein
LNQAIYVWVFPLELERWSIVRFDIANDIAKTNKDGKARYMLYDNRHKLTSSSAAGVTSGCSNTFFASSQGHSSGTCTPLFFFLPSSASAFASAFSAALGGKEEKGFSMDQEIEIINDGQ